MTELTFSALRNANNKRQREWYGTHPEPDKVFRALELGGETGELLNKVKKLVRQSSGVKGSLTTRRQIEAEAADVAICLDLLMRALGIDLAEAIVSKFNADSKKHNFETML